MTGMNLWRNPGAAAALGAALLFGAGTPIAKLLLGPVSPWLLAGLLYLGSGVGLAFWRRLRHAEHAHLGAGEVKWLAVAVLAGGVVAPVLLMWGLSRMPASGVSLMLNLEGVFTALIAWFVFHENFDRRIFIGMTLILAGAALLSWSDEARAGAALPALAVAAACVGWAVDNNLTRKVSLADATYIAMVKGLVSGGVNTAIALTLGATLPSAPILIGAATVGFLSYGVSLALFVVALRHVGAARTGAYFSTAPFAGALLAVALLHEPISARLVAAALLMGWGVWLHLTERHHHEHMHEAIEHEHEHVHDEHHQHAGHDAGPHTHWHRHAPMTHSHPHFPDEHHRGHRH
jgi:drug/metabolite transporter (DMT)-like permease